MKSSDVRQSFLDFFAERDHRVVASAPLVPQGDPTLLFTNAGMVPFKDYFLGVTPPPSPRATSSQKCLRVSGKHNDLENVGPSPRHHTFFEMLGNFSFGDYFKAEAIVFGWDLVTRVWGLPKEHLFATVYEEDEEAAELWRKISGLPVERIPRCGKKDNFWAMGDTGPCGPCSEIHVDRSPELPLVSWNEGSESGRYFEIWNLVFMQFVAEADGSLNPLPNPSIDTGAGLERVAAVLQGVDSNYDTDLFQPLLLHAAELSGKRYGAEASDDVSLRVIADHIRAVSFLLADGVIPGNEGRGYVLRRVLRRAVRHGMRLGLDEPFLYRILPTLAQALPVYPELAASQSASEATVRSEEEKFLNTIAAGARQVQEAIEESREQGLRHIPGATVFRLYDTFGLPVETVREIAEEEQFALDEAGFEAELEKQRTRSRTAAKGAQGQALGRREALGLDGLLVPEFAGYDRLSLAEVKVLRLARFDGDAVTPVESLGKGERGLMVLDRTVFYAEGGGQVGDVGLASSGGTEVTITDTQKDRSGVAIHSVEVGQGSLVLGAAVDLAVESERRRRTERNHTATHLLHAALREHLGKGVRQAGSLVAPDRLRFDFTHASPLSPEEKDAVEDSVVKAIRLAVETRIGEQDYRDAVASGAMALFGEKYGDRVRTVEVPGVSLELCGGCHVRNTGEIGGFRIVSERGVASGVRRIEAVTAADADALARQDRDLLGKLENELSVDGERMVEEVAALKLRLREADRELSKLRMQSIAGEADDDASVDVEGVQVVSKQVESAPFGELRSMADVLKQKLGSGVVVLGTASAEKVSLVVTVSDDLKGRISAGKLASLVGELAGGSGGGRPDFAQAGGKDAAVLPKVLEAVPGLVRGMVLEEQG